MTVSWLIARSRPYTFSRYRTGNVHCAQYQHISWRDAESLAAHGLGDVRKGP